LAWNSRSVVGGQAPRCKSRQVYPRRQVMQWPDVGRNAGCCFFVQFFANLAKTPEKPALN
jgi:hypothetical protein